MTKSKCWKCGNQVLSNKNECEDCSGKNRLKRAFEEARSYLKRIEARHNQLQKNIDAFKNKIKNYKRG